MYKLKQSLLSIIIGLAFAAGISYAATWVGPTSNPPGNNADAPVNVGNSIQYKKGALGVNGVFRSFSSAIFNKIQISDGTQGDGYVLTSDANGNASWQDGGGPFTHIAVFDSSTSWTVPAGVSQVIIETWGGGGGGGKGCADQYVEFGGTGGGGGGYGKGIYSVATGEVYIISVGLGGRGSIGDNGENGYETKVSRQSDGKLIISATGGRGGTDDGNFPGYGGTSTGLINITGGQGDDANVSVYSVLVSNGGRGGSAGNGGQGGGETEHLASNGTVPGGGGGGGACRRSTPLTGWFNGGNGASGRVVIWY